MSPPHRERPAWLAPLGLALAEALPRLHGAPPDARVGEVIEALAAALERGEVDLPLAGPPPEEVGAEGWPERHRRALAASPLTRDPDGPLVLEADRVLWRRWQRRREAVLAALIRRAGTVPATSCSPAIAPLPAEEDGLDPRQRDAVAAVLEHGLVLLEGGPGTGKTTTVAGMLAAFRRAVPRARLHLAAPTGKAAARLRAATGGRWPCSTLHRLLESRGERFGRDRRHPLALDLLVVDEVSMVDLGLMEALLDALPEACRLVLVGDPAQLPPIAPGAVLQELQRTTVREVLGPAAITLATPYRNAGAIAAVAATLRDSLGASAPALGSEAEASHDPLALLRPHLAALPADANLRWREARLPTLPSALVEPLERHQQDLALLARRCDPRDPTACRALLTTRDRLLVLSPVRQGPWGLGAIHRRLLGESAAAGPLAWPPGTPVLCTRNLAEPGLANGDVGILLGEPGDPSGRRLLFGSADGSGPGSVTDAVGTPVLVHPAQLAGALEPAFALTVHKAQGSEAEEVIVLLPQAWSGDARLLYTALTRARERVLLLTAAAPAPRAVGRDEGDR